MTSLSAFNTFEPSQTHPQNSSSKTTDSFHAEKPLIGCFLRQVLDTPNAEKLLMGLNQLFGGVRNSAITGSVALALHQANLGCRYVRSPGNLDVVVNQAGMERLRDLAPIQVASLGFETQAGSRNNLVWSDGEKRLSVDIIEASVSAAGRGLESASNHGGARFVPLDILISNLRQRAENEPLNNQVKGDLAAIYSVL